MKKNNVEGIAFFFIVVLCFLLLAAAGRAIIQIRYNNDKSQSIEIHEPASAWYISNKNTDDRFNFYQVKNKNQNFHFLVVEEQNGRSIVIIDLNKEAEYG